MKNRNLLIAPTAALSGAALLAGCSVQQNPEELGEKQPAIKSIVVESGANVRVSPETINGDDATRHLGKLVVQLNESSISSFRDNNDTDREKKFATIETPDGVREYKDRNGVWFGISTSDMINDACSTDGSINPLDDDAMKQVQLAQKSCEQTTDLLPEGTVWINEATIQPVRQ